MNISAQCLWEKGDSVDINPISVVLQQVSARKCEALLACVCEGGGKGIHAARGSGYFTERLVEWFHQKLIKKFIENMRETEITTALQDEINKIMQELRRYNKNREELPMHYSGILVCNNLCWMFQKGQTQILLYNHRYNKMNKREVILPQEEKVFEGRIQKNVGVLFCTKDLTELFESQELLEVFWGEHKTDEHHMYKRMQELWKVGLNRNMSKVGMIYIWTC